MRACHQDTVPSLKDFLPRIPCCCVGLALSHLLACWWKKGSGALAKPEDWSNVQVLGLELAFTIPRK